MTHFPHTNMDRRILAMCRRAIERSRELLAETAPLVAVRPPRETPHDNPVE